MSVLRVGVDLCGVDPAATSGADDAVLRTLQRAAEMDDPSIELVLFGLGDLQDERPELVEAVETHTLPVPRWAGLRAGAERAWLPRALRRSGVDVLHDVHASAPTGLDIPRVVHVPGLTALEQPRTRNPVQVAQLRRTIPRALAAADCVVVPSEFVKQRVVDLFGTPTAAIHVVPWPLPRHEDAMPIETVRARFGIIGKIILLPAVTHAHKEHVVAIRAMRHLVGRHKELTLVLTGDEGANESRVLAEIDDLDLGGHVVRTGRVSTAIMSALYEEAIAVVHPAIYGGFGHAVLESMACGVPVIISSAGAAPEVVGDAGAIIAPGDDAQLAIELHRILEDPRWRGRMVEDGLARASAYTLDRTAQGLVTAYRSVTAAL